MVWSLRQIPGAWSSLQTAAPAGTGISAEAPLLLPLVSHSLMSGVSGGRRHPGHPCRSLHTPPHPASTETWPWIPSRAVHRAFLQPGLQSCPGTDGGLGDGSLHVSLFPGEPCAGNVFLRVLEWLKQIEHVHWQSGDMGHFWKILMVPPWPNQASPLAFFLSLQNGQSRENLPT